MQSKGAIELAINQELLAAAMVGVLQQEQDTLIVRRGGFEVSDGGLQGELEASAEVDRFGELEGGRHFFAGD